MQLYNSLSRTKEEFIPNEAGKVSMYTCGPTVYHFAHIGNLRTYIMEDVLEKARWLRREYGAQYTAFGAETNQFQWFLKERLAAESAAAGIYLPLVEVRAASDKVLRIQSLQPDIRNGYLLFSRDQAELLRQLEQFPLGRNDDGPDALEGAVRLCKQGGRLTTLALRV